MPVEMGISLRPACRITAALAALSVITILVAAGCGGGGGDNSATHTIGVTVTGLDGAVVLQNNGGNTITVTTDGTHTFPDQYPSGTAYDITVLTQPAHQGCMVINPSGTVAGAPVESATAICRDDGLALFAGNAGGAGSADGTGAAASFQTPAGIATDTAGNVYVADFNNQTIRKVTPAGVVTTFAGKPEVLGSADGAGTAARFQDPSGVATDGAGNLYVADSGNNTIRKITPNGVVSTFAGTAGMTGSADGIGAAARFADPSGVATDSAGNIYVADSGNSTIRKITAAGVVSTLAGTAGVVGSADGIGAAASFNNPVGVAADGAGNLYVTDILNFTIRKITPPGVVTTLAGTPGVKGSTDGAGLAASFDTPHGIAADSAGNIYVSDSDADTIRELTPAGVVTTLAGTAGAAGSADGTGAAARFSGPSGVASDMAGNLYVADSLNNLMRKITPTAIVTTLAGQAGVNGSADGTGIAAQFYYPAGIATDSIGNVYVADTINDTIRKITPLAVVTTLAGTAGVTGSADGTGAAARFNFPDAVATDSAGNLFVADTNNHTIRKIASGGVVTTLAGKAGVTGSSDGTGPVARFDYPVSIATDGSGYIYVADASNNTIRKITPAGAVTTLAGTAGVRGWADGTGAAASFNLPGGVAADRAGNIYVSDSNNNTIRKITPGGVVATLAGTAGVTGSADGTGSAASFWVPQGLAIDGSGDVYVADRGNNTIRKVTPGGVVTTVVGQAGPGHGYFSPGALPGSLHSPWSVALFGVALYTQTNNGIVVATDVP